MKRLAFFFVFFCLLGNMLLPATASAAAPVSSELQSDVMDQLKAGASDTGEEEPADPRVIAGNIIRIILGLLGTIFVILLFLSGYWLLIARGEEEKVKKAQDTARRAIIGLVIIMISYAIVYYVMSALSGIAADGGPGKYY